MKQIGRYELLERVGQGGMGTVYKAFDPVLERIVAVKIISAQLDEAADARERFFREARAAGQLAHKNIVVVHDLGEHELQPYLAMEFLDGQNLEARLRKTGRVEPPRAVSLVYEVCEGLQFAHSRGVLHRDIKPANLFLTDSGTVKILDFGLARLVSSELTRSQTVLGTVNYMPPEQVRGERVDERGDIFSLGVVLYELLSGKKAFSGDSFGTIVYKILQTTPDPLQDVDGTIPGQLIEIVDRALAKNREDRYQSMGDLLRDLAVCEQAVSSRTARASYPAATWVAPPGSDRGQTGVGAGSERGQTGVGGRSDPALTPVRPRRWGVWVAAVAVIALVGAAWMLQRQKPIEPTTAAVPAAVTPSPAPAPAAAQPSTTTPAPPPETTPTVTAAPAAPPPPRDEPPAAPSFKARADEALATMVTARSEATAAGPGGPVARGTMQEATAMEQTARTSYRRGRFADAAAQYFQAAALFRSATLAARSETAAAEQQKQEQARLDQERREKERLAREREAELQARATPVAPPAAAPTVPPATAAAPAEPPPAPASTERAETQIGAVLAAYIRALEQRSVEALRRVWPDLGGSTERAIRTELARARQVRVQLTNQRITVSGTTATATAQRLYELDTDDGQRLSTVTETTFSLRKAGESWIIHEVAHRRP